MNLAVKTSTDLNFGGFVKTEISAGEHIHAFLQKRKKMKFCTLILIVAIAVRIVYDESL